MNLTIKIENLKYNYENKSVLTDIDISFEKGNVYSIVGPNGSGKTTLLSIIAKHLSKQQGSIYIYNNEINNISNKLLAKEMAVVTQKNSIDYSFTVKDIVMMGRNPYISRWSEPTEKDLEKIDYALTITDTKKLEDNFITNLSGGEFQRVILARAIAQDTKILLLDEPITGLDIHHQLNFMELIRKLCDEKSITVINVIHDLNLALYYSDEIIMLNEGKIYAKGITNEVITKQNVDEVYKIDSIVMEHPRDKDKTFIVF